MFLICNFLEVLVSIKKEFGRHFYKFAKSLVLNLIKSQSLSLKIDGSDIVSELIQLCVEHKQTHGAYIVSGAGIEFINGMHELATPWEMHWLNKVKL